MKSKLLSILTETYPEYISGEKLSNMLNCSRTAVWKHISQLKKEGYEITAVRNKGYLLEHSEVSYSGHGVQAKLFLRYLNYKVMFHAELQSTQQLAQQLAAEGIDEGALILADHQSTGRGRLGREWSTARGTGIAASLILKPDIPIHTASQLTLVAAVSAAKLFRKYGIEAQIKWPNDILVNHKKICGILTEMQADPDRVRALILGIGLNVNETNFPPSLTESAVSMKLLKNKNFDRAEVTAELFNIFEVDYRLFLAESFTALKDEWIKYSATLGRKVQVVHNNQRIQGTAVTIEDSGALKIIDDTGKEHLIYSGDVTEQ